MNSGIFLFIILCTLYLCIMCTVYFKSKSFLKYSLITALQGVCSLFAVNLIGKLISIHISVNLFSLAISSVGGISGVIFLLLCDIFMK